MRRQWTRKVRLSSSSDAYEPMREDGAHRRVVEGGDVRGAFDALKLPWRRLVPRLRRERDAWSSERRWCDTSRRWNGRATGSRCVSDARH